MEFRLRPERTIPLTSYFEVDRFRTYRRAAGTLQCVPGPRESSKRNDKRRSDLSFFCPLASCDTGAVARLGIRQTETANGRRRNPGWHRAWPGPHWRSEEHTSELQSR